MITISDDHVTFDNPANLRGFYTLANIALLNHPPYSLVQTPRHTQYQIQARGIESKPTYPLGKHKS